ncbi:DNA excision repair protein ERCC-5 homolog [Neodiprion pinetum]|uniref:DNA excision repair protein ERCC-5 homolog n=1 Tax=Neodiprion pinetum TaxID=441929 RepID=UPI001EDE6A4C|nr:DNA excision repair protein ERCC-5 [Neodiprion pinetum]XP_046482837.1 DNA excision repair protein ERCC-5 [Neodiprion pinetum]XP_046482839.1 DNA excision repair protein ERCC-5 [Neodiprion pinetum]
MGVHGLWRLLDAAGKPVALETLEGKVLAVDVSIWLHQVMQGYQDGHGSPLPNAHLLGLFNRICKLLYYKIKPVFVFDGGVPLLKKNTIASRRKQKSMASSKAQKMKNDLINNLLKRTVVKGALGAGSAEKQEEKGETSEKVDRSSVHSSLNLFKLPVIPSSSEFVSEDEDDPETETESSVQLSPRKQAKWKGNIHSVDVSSTEFRALPPDVRHDILTDLKASRKENSWGCLHEMPEDTHDFSNYQMKRLLKRRNVQECLEEAEREMGGKTMTLEELDVLLTEQGIATTTKIDNASRIAADNLTRFVYINGVNKDVLTAKKPDITKVSSLSSNSESNGIPSEDGNVEIIENLKEYELDEDWESDWESSDEPEVTVMKSKKLKKLMKSSDVNPAMMYMLEHSGLSQEEILCIIEQSKNKSKKSSRRDRPRDSKRCLKALDFIIKTEPADSEDGKSQPDTDNVPVSTNSRSYSPIDVPIECPDFAATEFSESTNNKCPKPAAHHAIENVTVNEEAATTSSSESDDFVEVTDVPVPNISYSAMKENKPVLEITIVQNLQSEDDMFANVFANNASLVQVTQPPVHEMRRGSDLADQWRSQIEVPSPEQSKVNENVHETPLELSVQTTSEENRAADGYTAADSISSPQIDEKAGNVEALTVNNKAKDDQQPAPSVVDEDKKKAFQFPTRREELITMQEQLETEEKELSGTLGRLERQATDITDQMRMEAQELLRFFGIPYVIAPMEAEAQCAYLETINLTDGTITDDSDIWLFGGHCVYKNFFNLNKHVMQFRSSDIRHHFNLTREQMVQLALLVGSDYTVGVTGIGPVTGLEILAAFPAEGGNLLRGLTNFRYWVNSGRAAGPGKASLRTKLKNVHVEKGFPSEAVVQAYLAPTVDESKEGFTWNEPNTTLLADFTRNKFGWTKSKFEVIFNPIMKRQAESKKQKGIDDYFQVKISRKCIEGTLSKRVQKAVERLGGGSEREEETADFEMPQKRTRKSKPKSSEPNLLKPIIEEKEESSAVGVVKIIPSTEMATKLPIAKPECIPQREKDKANALKNKLRAIEVFRKSKKGPGYAKRSKRTARKIKSEAELSESSDSS